MRPLLAILALAAAVYAPFVGGGLLTDDFVHLEHLESVRNVEHLVLAPDTFDFYRPVTQASLKIETILHPGSWAAFRITNLALHLAVLASAFALSGAALSSRRAAALATLAFALTPKAHPIAVLWLSARGEILMMLWSFFAAIAWIRWTRGAGRRWLAGTIVAYGLAILSKEAALLLPFALLFSPGAVRDRGARILACAGLLLVGGAAFAWRMQVGAVMPTRAEGFYNFSSTVARWSRNATNYFGRLLPAPVALVLVVALPARAMSRLRTSGSPAGALRSSAAIRAEGPRTAAIVAFSVAWLAVFLVPVLPIVARNELYLYAPVFGLCLLAGHLADRVLAAPGWSRAAAIGMALYIAGAAGYQISRTAAIGKDLVFSDRLVSALRSAPMLADARGVVSLSPGDAATARFLQDAVGGYTTSLLEHVFDDGRFRGPGAAGEAERADVRLRILYREDRVIVDALPER